MANYIADVMAKKIDGKYMVSTISGAWDILTPEEYNLMMTGRAEQNSELYKRLDEEGIIITKNNLDLIKAGVRQRYSFLCEPVTLHIVVVTNRCTHQCIYCHSASPKEEKSSSSNMSKKTADKITDFILSVPSRNLALEFQGGESLLNLKTVIYIVRKLGKNKGNKKILCRMATNLSNMTVKIFDELIKSGIKPFTSLDGPKSLHDKQRVLGNKSSYDNVVKWIKYARERFNERIHALTTITRYSLEYGAKAIIDEYLKQKIYTIRLRELNLCGVAISNWKQIGYSPEEFYKFWKQGVDYCINLYEKQGIPMKEGSITTILERLLSPTGGDYMCFRSPCGAGINQISYDSSGNIYFCDASRGYGEDFIIGDVYNMTYDNLVEKTKGLRGLSNLVNSCRQCIWAPYCGTCLLRSSGSKEGFIPIKQRDFHCKLRQLQLQYVMNLLMGEHKDTLLEWWTAATNITKRESSEQRQ